MRVPPAESPGGRHLAIIMYGRHIHIGGNIGKVEATLSLSEDLIRRVRSRLTLENRTLSALAG